MSEKLKLPILLLVSDNPSINHWIKKNLDGQFYFIDASTSAQAIEIVQTTPLHFVILDAGFEECDPLKLASKLRAANTTVPIFLITGRLKKSYRDIALQAGVTDFLNDQLEMVELQNRIAVGDKTASTRKKTARITPRTHENEKQASQNFLKNKTLLNEQALHLLAEMKRRKDSIMLLLLRIDQFQNWPANSETEKLMLALFQSIKRRLRPDDLLIPSQEGRFILLLPHTSIEESRKIAEKIRREIQQEAFDYLDQPLHLTISIVMTPLEASPEKYQQMVESASIALKQSQTMTNIIISLDKESL